jgi:hypothetical protein
MQLLFKNGVQVPIELNNSPVQDTILGYYKHLQHVPIPFRPWDNPFYFSNSSYDSLVDCLINYGKEVHVEVARDKCIQLDPQAYFNYLHKVYENNYNGDTKWLNFHESIHQCEYYLLGRQENALTIDYREKGGPLEKAFNIDWLSAGTTKIRAGDVYIKWGELGKSPYSYWDNGEPDNMTRLCELAKPWKICRNKISIALYDTDLLANLDRENFDNWWNNYKQTWCQHWAIADWTLDQMYSAIVIGRVDSADTILEQLKNQICPIKVQL